MLGGLVDLPFAVSPVVVGLMAMLLFGRQVRTRSEEAGIKVLSPATPFVASFIGSSNRLGGRFVGGRTELEGQDLGLAQRDEGAAGDARIDAFVRPHDVEVKRPTAADSKGIPAAVVRTTRLGWQVKIEVQLPSTRLITVQCAKEQADAIAVRPGDKVLLTLRRAKLFAEGSPPIAALAAAT